MGKKLRAMVLVLAVLVVLVVIYQSSIAKITGAGHEWLRRQSSQFCHSGYRLRGEHVWHNEDGQTYYVYIFESTVVHRGIDPGIQILLENSEHQEIDRIDVASPHPMIGSSLLDSIHPSRLEVVFHIREPKSKMQCQIWELKDGQLVESEFV
ncbi:hypothetical protein DTL21_16835 [Bremerella cremea]|uniref:Uncharacterized protein n=1 Tax=Blastopirellula marina TaxID=124 RepID=A0A2S8FIA4_9BACT|nr:MULTISPECIES: hypothetical protein [Pirellulaceae]PQO31919.1 hypothetical protein C5Y83_16820 [Blastopirellula marina]RCS44985.1 hypothetical protein DTL21_16835 [Bremerella cremea]